MQINEIINNYFYTIQAHFQNPNSNSYWASNYFLITTSSVQFSRSVMSKELPVYKYKKKEKWVLL